MQIADGLMLRKLSAGRDEKRMDGMDLRWCLNVIWRRKWQIIVMVVAVTGSIAALIVPTPFIYRATATLMIESKQANVVSIQDVYDPESRGIEYYQTQYEVLKSRPIAEKVIASLNLASIPELAESPEKIPYSRSALVEEYLKRLRISPVPRSQLVKISFDTRDPALAAKIANAHAAVFIESYREAKESVTYSATRWLTARLDELREKLTASEENLQAFKEQEHIIDVDGFQALPARELNEMTSKLVDARRDLSQTESAYAQIVQARDRSLEEKMGIPAIRADRIVQQLGQAFTETDLKVMELSKRFGPEHPKMKAALSERASAEAALNLQVNNVMESIKNEHAALQGQTRAIESSVSKTRSNMQLEGRKESEYRSLLREVETNRQLYDLFYKRVSETKETRDLDSANARVVEPAAVPLKPVAPQKTLMLTLASVLSLLVGIIIAFAREYFDNKIKHGTDVEQRLGLPMLGFVPKLPRKAGALGTALIEGKDRDFGEAIRTVRTSIALSSLDKPCKSVLITSSIADEGKTAVACNLAAAFSQLERVLLIDADLRRPSVAAALGLSNALPGLADICANTALPSACIVKVERFDVITAGDAKLNPQELFSSPRLPELLAKLNEKYDRIIIDSPPTLPVIDVLLLANHVDAMVYVVKAQSTTTRTIKAGLQRLKKPTSALLGIVLNQVSLKTLSAYGDYGGSYYGDYLPKKKYGFSLTARTGKA